VGSLVKRAAFFGQTLRPLDESYAKALLQFDDAARQRGLRTIPLPDRGSEAAMQRRCVEIGKRSQVHDRCTSERMRLRSWSVGSKSERIS